MSEQRNFIRAVALSILIIVIADFFFKSEVPPADVAASEQVELGIDVPSDNDVNTEKAVSEIADKTKPEASTAPLNGESSSEIDIPKPDNVSEEISEDKNKIEDSKDPTIEEIEAIRNAALQNDNVPRVQIDADRLKGSLRLVGAKIDDLLMKDHKNTIEEYSDNVSLLSPEGSYEPQHIEHGWVASNKNKDVKLPNAETLWIADKDILKTDSPVTLSWDNGEGLIFKRTYSIDENYLITVSQAVENNSGKEVVLYPYGLIKKHRKHAIKRSIVHTGPIGYLNEELEEIKDGDFNEGNKLRYESTGGWVGITEKYWMSILVLDKDKQAKIRVSASGEEDDRTIQVDYLYPAITVASGDSATTSNQIFSGAKRINLLDKYEDDLGINHFDLTIDFGWYYFLTKPFLYILTWFNKITGHMGIAIILATILLRGLMFPVANASYKSMTKMKKIQPKVKRLQKLYDHDKVKLQQEMMKLYKKEEVNPAAGCLPMLIQIPVFFSLYKVLSISIEMRHAPFYGWVKDLSAPDPTSVLTLLGTIPVHIPSAIDIGIWPLIMGITMVLQQKLSPQPAEKGQAKMMMLMPVLFTFMLGHFAAGLVIYWTLSNIIGIVQQKIIMKQMDVD
jgi:YidC/Oxa1 family membrane protein insertase